MKGRAIVVILCTFCLGMLGFCLDMLVMTGYIKVDSQVIEYVRVNASMLRFVFLCFSACQIYYIIMYRCISRSVPYYHV